MIKNNKTINTIALCYALFQFSTMLIASSQTNYNNAFVTFYQKLNNTTDASVANAATFISNQQGVYSWSTTQAIANGLKTNEAETTGLFLTQSPSTNKNKFAGAITDLSFQDIKTALNNAKNNINPSTSSSSSAGSTQSSNPNTGSSTSAGSSNPSTGSSGSAGSSSSTSGSSSSTSNPILTATDKAAADLLKNIQSSIGTYNQYLASLNKGIPALAVPTVPAGVPLVG
ncbi:MAG: hypothetical protein ACXWL5_01105 [Candidatus Chromulinivorax sp.]